jgi:LAGLIDADG DNA endonuclease family protein
MKHFHVKQSLHPWYVTGFCERSASFTYSRSGSGFGLYFGIKVGVKDVAILQSLQAFFGGAGRIYRIKPSSRSSKGEASAYFRITRARELARLVTHFDRFTLTGSKAQQYLIWRGMAFLKQRFRRPESGQLAEMALQLSAVSGGATQS